MTGGEIIPYIMFQDPALMWGPLNQDHRHRFTTSWVMDLPGAEPLGADALALGGWQWSGVMQYQTGRPFTVTSGTDNSLDGIGNDRAKLTGADVNAVPTTPCLNCVWYFNPAAFATNDLGTFGNVGERRVLRSVAAQLGHGRCPRTSASTPRRTCRRAWSSSTSSTR